MLHIYRLPLGGYVHPGDIMVLLCGFVPGGWLGAFASGIGSALADLYVGANQYAIPTFFIKMAMPLVVSALTHRKNRSSIPYIRTICAFILASVVMILGYFTFDVFMSGTEELGVLKMLMGSVPQAVTGIAGGYILLFSLDKAGFFRRYKM